MLQNFALTWVLIFALGMAGVMAGPGANQNPEPAEPERPTLSSQPEFRVAMYDEPYTLAPYWLTSAYGAEVTDRIFGDGLMRVGYDYRPEPALAEALPTISADGRTYTFKLRKGVLFHDGKELTAADVAFSYNVLLDDYYTGSYKSLTKEISAVRAVDAYTVEFSLPQPFAPFLLGAATVPILPKHMLDRVPVKEMETSAVWRTPVGAGPYRFVEHRVGRWILLERNPTYWEAGMPGAGGGTVGPHVDRLRFLVMPEDTVQIAALENGDLSILSAVVSPEAERLKADFAEKLVAYEWNRMGYGYQTFNNEKWPTNIKAVRQALSYGLNRQSIIEAALGGNATIPAGVVPPGHWAHNPALQGYPYDPDKARTLLESVGFRLNAAGIYEQNGKPLKLKFVATLGSTLIKHVAEISQKNWQAIGAETEIVLVDFNTLLDKHMKPGDFHVTFSGLGFSVDPHYSFDQNYHSRNVQIDSKGVNLGANRARYRNPRVDELIDQAKVSSDQNLRLSLYHEAEQVIVDDAVVNWIYINRYTDFAQKEIQGIVNWPGYGIDTRLMTQWKLPAE